MRAPHPILAPRVGIRISAQLGLLSGRLVTTATATYGRLGLGSIEAKVLGELGELGRGSVKSKHICETIGVDRAAVSRTVSSLVARGLVDRIGGRNANLSLTAAGHRLSRSVRDITEEREARLFEDFSDSEIDMTLGYLRRLSLNVTDIALAPGELQKKLAEALDQNSSFCAEQARVRKSPSA